MYTLYYKTLYFRLLKKSYIYIYKTFVIADVFFLFFSKHNIDIVVKTAVVYTIYSNCIILLSVVQK